MSARWSSLLVICAAIACASPPAPDAGPSAPPTVALHTAYWAGCDDHVEGACVLVRTDAPPTVRAWLDVPPSTRVEVEIDGDAVEPTRVLADRGTRVEVVVPVGAEALSLHGEGISARLELRWHTRDPAMEAAWAAFHDRSLDAMCTALSRLPADADALDRVDELRLTRGCGDLADERRGVELDGEAADVALASGLPMTFVRAATPIIHACLGSLGDLACAEAWSARLDRELPEDAGVLANYARGLVAARRGQLVTAKDRFAESQRWAERLGMAEDFDLALEESAMILAELGRTEPAREAATRLYGSAKDRADACDRARTINNAAWALQVLAEAGLVDEPPLDWMLEEAEIYESGACDDPKYRLNARLNVVSALLAGGDVDAAEQWFQRIATDDPLPPDDEFAADVEYFARATALASNNWEYAPVALLSSTPRLPDALLRWRSRVQDAQMLERFGLEAAALEAWEQAEALLDAEVTGVGVAQGRESFISLRRSSAQGLLEAMLRAGRGADALCRIRIARGRALRAADRRRVGDARAELTRFDGFARLRSELDADAAEDWSHPADEQLRRQSRRDERRREALALLSVPEDAREGADSTCALLPARASDEAFLAIVPTRDDTIVIADGPGGLRADRVASIPADEDAAIAWAGDMLGSFEAELADARILRAMPVGRAWTVPIHAARRRGEAVVERLVVTYGLDLPSLGETQRRTGHALVLSDPTGDLPFAREEAELVATTLAAARWHVDRMDGSAVDRSGVVAELGGLDLFHYAGHGAHRGDEGWEAALLLERDQSIEAADILAAPAVPRAVVLAGCETGEVSAGLVDGGMSLGRAFLLAGADAVVVGDREVGDADSLAFARAFYDAAGAPEDFDPARAMHHAYRLRAAAGAATRSWSGFRVLVR